ncbi:UrcA family protein [Wenzhouxiangella sp. AB-CW3]|uniref:UrcA family protein n=1 Tax=Wenzhouxiangella sp. AB-CW3 TaxID=2771012 RepID=UPI00168A5753|nr:UrcA family protein [Wenzhouxiangella sp. AB-CW3]QOC22874.1 UrcA family protein [Wenzhouxiangella sp. AB-CW3]
MSGKLLLAVISTAFLIVLTSSVPVPVVASEPETDEVVDRIRVVAPRVTRSSRGSGRYVVETAERSDYVYYGDLDLTRTTDLFELQDRIGEMATEICELLTEMFPRGSPSTATCIQRAIDDASPLVDAAARAAIGK